MHLSDGENEFLFKTRQTLLDDGFDMIEILKALSPILNKNPLITFNKKWLRHFIKDTLGKDIPLLADDVAIIKYLADFSLTIDDESTVELIDGKYKAHHPVLRTIDGELKINFYNGDLNILEPSRYYFDEYEVISVDGNKAILKSPQYISDEEKTIDLTVELEKVNGQWKVCGGTIFTDDEHGSFHDSDLFAPRTGEDFSLITHTLVIGVCAALMLVLSKRKRTVE